MSSPSEPRTPAALVQALERRVRADLEVTFTRNRVRFLSFAVRDGLCRLRINRDFLEADDEVLDAVAQWVDRRGRCPRPIQKFIESRQTLPPRPQRIVLRPKGRCHDLEELLRRVNEEFFDGRMESRITWGRRTRKRKARVRRLGSYYRKEDLIRIHPVLDRREVPRAFVEYVIFHELLHATQDGDGRPHDAHFRAALKRHPLHQWALDWQRQRPELLGLK